MPQKILTILTVISLFFPQKSGQAQFMDTGRELQYLNLGKEVDSIRQQVNLNLDLIKYQLEKDPYQK